MTISATRRPVVFCAVFAGAVWAAQASPAMAPAAEASAAASASLDLATLSRGEAASSAGFDLIGFLAAWSTAVPLNTRPFIGLLFSIR